MEENTLDLSEKLINSILAYKQSAIIFAARDINLFKILSGDHSIDEISEMLNVRKKPLLLIIKVLVAMNYIIEKDNEIYIINSDFKELLTEESEKSLIPYIDLESLIFKSRNTYQDIIDALYNRKEYQNEIRNDDNTTSAYINLMDIGNRYASLHVLRMLSNYKNGRILDIGGGTGRCSIMGCSVYPNIQFHIYEKAIMIDSIKKNVEASGFKNRIFYYEKDIITDDFDEDYDAVIISNVLHLLNESNIDKVLEKIYFSLKSGGILVINDFVLNQNKKSFNYLLSMLDSLSLGNEYIYYLEDIKIKLISKGFDLLEVKDHDSIPTIIIASQKL